MPQKKPIWFTHQTVIKEEPLGSGIGEEEDRKGERNYYFVK